VPEYVRIDNLKSAILEASFYEPNLYYKPSSANTFEYLKALQENLPKLLKILKSGCLIITVKFLTMMTKKSGCHHQVAGFFQKFLSTHAYRKHTYFLSLIYAVLLNNPEALLFFVSKHISVTLYKSFKTISKIIF
jgi:hypothetical protein